MHDRPTAAELVASVREFLERDVMTSTEGRVSFHARVAANVLGVVERELALGSEHEELQRAALADLLGHDGALPELEAQLAMRIRNTTLDHRRAEVVAHVRNSVRAKLEVANPEYLEP
jgi:Domain of unknown function (DUF6285)